MKNPDSNLADSSFQLRVSRKTLATLAKFMTEKGFQPRSKSELGRVAMEILKNHLVANKLVDPVDDSSEATKLLNSLNLGPLSIRGREAVYMKQLQKEVSVQGGILTFDPFEPKRKVSDVDKEDKERINRLLNEFKEGGE